MSEARQILDTIISEFSIAKLNLFFREKSRQFSARDESYSHYNDSDFKGGLKLGEINFSDGDSLIICVFEVKKELSERSVKKAQYQKAKDILKSTENQKFSAGIFVFYDATGNFRFSLVYPESIGARRQWNNFRRFTYFVSKEFTNKTFLKQIGEKELTKLNNIKSAFSITAVTDIFYDEFFKIYDKVVMETKKVNKIGDAEEARDFVLLFAIRTVFLGFIQNKKWLGDDNKFIQNYLKEYVDRFRGKNMFYTKWLAPLFFEALNSPQGRKVAYGSNDFSPETEAKLQMAPYLNGGLFKPKRGYDNNGWIIPDKEIEEFFGFLFSHSFTIEENSLADEDLQLNPEFLGIIFERLVNKADGAVYTPRTEVDLMCRLSLVKWLQKNLENQIKADNLYELFFRESEKDEDQKQGSFSQKEAEEILEKLQNLAICDPAVGSGAFLVGMIQVLDETEQVLRNTYGLDGINVFERKKQIIKNSLYGVEVKEWAVWICQLRLWLSLFVDAPDDLKNSLEPILPSLDFKVRQGDSLVQRIGSKAFPISGHNLSLNKSIKDKITKLRKFKVDYFDNKSEALVEFDEPKHKELAVYNEILDSEIKEKEEKLKGLKNIKSAKPMSLFGQDKEVEQTKLDLDKEAKEVLKNEISELKEQKLVLSSGGKPLVWSIEFAEVFAEKDGFDIIIGNPPYVRQEAIADPTGKIKDKKVYKDYLQEMVKLDFPNDFPPKAKINAQSDLYTYFYIRGLRLLNPQGMHTFICSNSWLDVGYGVWLQNFLLKHCPVEFIIDNHAKRSFSAADVNTIISIIHAPQKKIDEEHLVKFIAFKKSFEEVIYTENILAIEHAKKVESNDIFRVYPIATKDLKDAGTEYENEAQKTLGGEYVGDKWGGKYIVSPDVLFNLLTSKSKKLVLLQTIYKYTQRNNLSTIRDQRKLVNNGKYFPFLSSIKDVKKIGIKSSDLKYGINAQGEEIESMVIPDIISNRFISDRMFFLEGGKFAVSDTFFIIKLKENYDRKTVCAILNSSFSLLLTEIIGRKNLGGGLLTFYGYELEKMYIVNPSNFSSVMLSNLLKHYNEIKVRVIKSIFEECGINPTSEVPIDEQEPNPLPDRLELDKIVFDALELTENERKEVYRAVCRLVWNRISKAESV